MKPENNEILDEIKKLKAEKSSQRYIFTRRYSGWALATTIAIGIYMVVSISIRPELAEAYEKVSGVIIMLIVSLIGLVAHYMGISNQWGMKK